MATNTTNYNWTKPDYEDDADIKDLNDNFDGIDAQVKAIDDQVQLNKNNISYIEDKGAKNLIPYPYAYGSSYTQNNITFTAADDGVIRVNGTVSGGNAYYGIIANGKPKPILQDGAQYVVSIHATGTGKVSQFYINEKVGGDNVQLYNINAIEAGDYADTFTYTATEGNSGISCTLKIASSNTNPIDMYLSIMICKKSDWDISHAYQPYAMSNAELTAKEQANENNISKYVYETVTVNLASQDISWTAYGSVYASSAIPLTQVGTVLSFVLIDWSGIRDTDLTLIPYQSSSAGNGFKMLSSTNTFLQSNSKVVYRVFGIKQST